MIHADYAINLILTLAQRNIDQLRTSLPRSQDAEKQADNWQSDFDAVAPMLRAAPHMLQALERVIKDGGYDDDGDFFLTHRPSTAEAYKSAMEAGETPEDDYLDPEAIELVNRAIREARGA